MPPVKSYFGSYQPSPTSETVEATVLILGKTVEVGYRQQAQHFQFKWDIRETEAVYDSYSQSTRIRNRNTPAITITVPGKEATEYISSLNTELAKPWHQTGKAREWGKNLLIFFGIAGVLVLLYFLIVPWLAGLMASRVSVKTEEQFGEAVYGALGLESLEDTAASYEVNQFFATMDIPSAYRIRISVIKGSTVNAFALPGGRIVVYDALLEKINSYPELAALLSHEFTHVNNQHSTRSIFRRLGSRVFIGVLFGRFGSVTSILVDHADNIKSLTYSRRLEKEADMDGLELLKERKIDPSGFSSLFYHLKESAPGSSMPEFLASHPDIDKRIKYISEASQGAEVNEHIELKAIFEKIKQNQK